MTNLPEPSLIYEREKRLSDFAERLRNIREIAQIDAAGGNDCREAYAADAGSFQTYSDAFDSSLEARAMTINEYLRQFPFEDIGVGRPFRRAARCAQWDRT